MKKFFLCTLSFILFYSLTLAQTALIELPFTYSDGVAEPRVLTAGLDPTAEDGLDPDLGETPLPPLPPPPSFVARFELPDGVTESYKNIRQGDDTPSSEGNKIHTINYRLDTGGILTITWDLPGGVELNLKDPFGGIIFDEDFPSGPGTYTITFALTSPPGVSMLNVFFFKKTMIVQILGKNTQSVSIFFSFRTISI
jgi:hypothetical protein